MKNIIMISLFDSTSIADVIENPLNVILLYAMAGVLLYGLLYRFFIHVSVAFVYAFLDDSGKKTFCPVMMSKAEELEEEVLSITFRNSFRKVGTNKPVVAVVESDVEFRAWLETHLSAEYVIRSFESGEEVQAYMQREHIDAVIGNIHLRGMSGIELSMKLKNNMETSAVPIILYTSSDDPNVRDSRLISLADSFLLQPFSVEDLKVEMTVLIKNAQGARRSFLQEIFGKQFLEIRGNIDMDHEDWIFFNEVKDFILENMDNESLKIKDIALHVNMCQTSFYNRWISLTGNTPSSFLRRLRMEKARELLESGKYLVADIPVLIGIRDDKHFRTTYKKFFKKTPSQSIK